MPSRKYPERDTSTRWSREIVKILRRVADYSQVSRYDVFEDWLQVVCATLEMVPTHGRHLLANGEVAPPSADPPEIQALWQKVAQRYNHLRSIRIFDEFQDAFRVLLDSTQEWQDCLGDCYEALGMGSPDMGQFFTPWDLAVMMADLMCGDLNQMIHERLKAAIAASELATAALVAATTIKDPGEAKSWFLTRVLPYALEHYDPISVCDPCCGSGVMLLAVGSKVEPWANALGLVEYYGQDLSLPCVLMARINVMIYGLGGKAATIKHALDLANEELALLPAYAAEAYATAIEAHRAGDEGLVREIQAYALQWRIGAMPAAPVPGPTYDPDDHTDKAEAAPVLVHDAVVGND